MPAAAWPAASSERYSGSSRKAPCRAMSEGGVWSGCARISPSYPPRLGSLHLIPIRTAAASFFSAAPIRPAIPCPFQKPILDEIAAQGDIIVKNIPQDSIDLFFRILSLIHILKKGYPADKTTLDFISIGWVISSASSRFYVVIIIWIPDRCNPRGPRAPLSYIVCTGNIVPADFHKEKIGQLPGVQGLCPVSYTHLR